ncbi:MAG: hypothetical protein WAO00_08195 [Chthoniobacterales bacterium]
MKRWLYIGGTVALTITAFVVGCMVGIENAPPVHSSIPPHEFEQYTLFTWNKGGGDVCFAIMLEFQRSKFIHSWFPKRRGKCGISELKNALLTLPKESNVLWEDWPPKKLDYPPDAIIDEVTQFAEANGIHVKQSPALR